MRRLYAATLVLSLVVPGVPEVLARAWRPWRMRAVSSGRGGCTSAMTANGWVTGVTPGGHYVSPAIAVVQVFLNWHWKL